MFAIKPRGVGNLVAWREIREDWPLAEGETFITADDPTGKVLAEDELSLRDETAAEVFAKTKTAKMDALASRRYTAETGGITVGQLSVKTDRETQSILTGARTLAKEDPTYTVDWKVGPGAFVTLDAATIIAAADAVAAHVQACFSNEKTIATQIDAAADQAALDAIDINAGW